MQVIIFTLGEEDFAVETMKVSSINERMPITAVPGSPQYINGIINLRGNVISLLDIKNILNIKKTEEAPNNIIIADMNGEQVGMPVDKVNNVIDITDDQVEKMEKFNNTYFKGVINLKENIVTLIDIDRLIEGY